MPRSYAHHKIREALKETTNKQEAIKQLATLCAEDHQFLLGLTMPFLGGVITQAINHAERHEGEAPPVLDLNEQGDVAELGIELVRSVLEETGPRFGTKDRSKTSLKRPTKASQSHIDALQQLAKKSKKE